MCRRRRALRSARRVPGTVRMRRHRLQRSLPSRRGARFVGAVRVPPGRRTRPRRLRSAGGGGRLLRTGGKGRPRRLRLSGVRRGRTPRRGHRGLPPEVDPRRSGSRVHGRRRARRCARTHRVPRRRSDLPPRDRSGWGGVPPAGALSTGYACLGGRLPGADHGGRSRRPPARRLGRMGGAGARGERRPRKSRPLPPALAPPRRVRPPGGPSGNRRLADRHRGPQSGPDARARPNTRKPEPSRGSSSVRGRRGGRQRFGRDAHRALAWSWWRSKHRSGGAGGYL